MGSNIYKNKEWIILFLKFQPGKTMRGNWPIRWVFCCNTPDEHKISVRRKGRNTRKVKEAHLHRREGIPLTHTHTTIEKEQTHQHQSQRDGLSNLPLIYNPSLSRDQRTHTMLMVAKKDTVPRLKWSHRQPQWAARWHEQSWKVGSWLTFYHQAALPAPTSICTHVQSRARDFITKTSALSGATFQGTPATTRKIYDAETETSVYSTALGAVGALLISVFLIPDRGLWVLVNCCLIWHYQIIS